MHSACFQCILTRFRIHLLARIRSEDRTMHFCLMSNGFQYSFRVAVASLILCFSLPAAGAANESDIERKSSFSQGSTRSTNSSAATRGSRYGQNNPTASGSSYSRSMTQNQGSVYDKSGQSTRGTSRSRYGFSKDNSYYGGNRLPSSTARDRFKDSFEDQVKSKDAAAEGTAFTSPPTRLSPGQSSQPESGGSGSAGGSSNDTVSPAKVAVLESKVNQLKNKVEILEQKIDVLTHQTSSQISQHSQLHQRVNDLTTRVVLLENTSPNVTGMQKQIDAIKQVLNNIPGVSIQ